MPDVYQENTCDIVGMMVGRVTWPRLVTPKHKTYNGFRFWPDYRTVQEGDVILGLPSNGPHTNGYTLIRKLVSDLTHEEIKKLGLCTPHKSYYPVVHELQQTSIRVHAYCHITGTINIYIEREITFLISNIYLF